MSKKGISRRQFVAGAAVVAAATAVPVLSGIATAEANPTAIAALSPGAAGWVPLDPKALARQAYEIYKGKWAGQSACCEATWWPIIGAIGALYPSTFGQIPMGVFNFGGGGVNSWGAMCGCTNAGAAVLKTVTGNSNAIDEYLQWYQVTAEPSFACYLDYLSGTWTPGGSATGGWSTAGAGNTLPIPISNTPKSKAGGVLCHNSLANWRVAGGSYEVSVLPLGGQSDRCGKLCYDCAYKLATMVNSYMAGGTFSPLLDASAAPVGAANYNSSTSCLTSGCHGTSAATGHPYISNTKQKCTTCHVERVGDSHNL